MLAGWAVDTAAHAVTVSEALPPIAFATDWNYMLGLVALLAAVAIVVIVVDLITVRRINVASSLRATGKNG